MQYRKLGRFHLDQPVAQGGMGEIVRSVDDLGRTIALKKILAEFQGNDKFRELFIREGEITFQLDHPNIVKAYRFENIGNQLVLALEYLEGVNLREVLRSIYERRRKIPFIIVLTIMQRVLRGLDYAHKKRDERKRPLGIIHRDLNPSNIFVTFTGEVKILDFGISKATQKEIHQLTPKGELRGKMCYLAPEQINGKPLDRRADIFSCGIVMWELLTGEPLFLREQDEQVMAAIIGGEYRSASIWREDIPEEVEAVLRRALSTDPAKRFKDCAEFESAIDAASRKICMPGIGEEEISVFIRALFNQGADQKDSTFMSGFAWLLTQVRGKENEGVEIARRVAEENPTKPYVQLNLARCLLAAGHKTEGLRLMRRLARVDSLETASQEILEWLGVRRRPVVPFLTRANPVNYTLGVLRHRILGPTPYQMEFLAA